MAPKVGLEPTTNRLTAGCSTTELLRINFIASLATSYSHRGKPPTTIGAKELNFRVRYGNGCDLFAIITRLSTKDKIYYIIFIKKVNTFLVKFSSNFLFFQNWIKLTLNAFKIWLSPRSISIRQLHVSPHFHLEPIYLIVFEGSYLLA